MFNFEVDTGKFGNICRGPHNRAVIKTSLFPELFKLAVYYPSPLGESVGSGRENVRATSRAESTAGGRAEVVKIETERASYEYLKYHRQIRLRLLSPPPSFVFRYSCNSPGGDSCQHASRKRRRGMIEKKRRDRINASLGELRRLVPAAARDPHSGKLEKAEILQLTVEHLRTLRNKGKILSSDLGTRVNESLMCITDECYETGSLSSSQRIVRVYIVSHTALA